MGSAQPSPSQVPAGLRRHLEGWQLGLLAVALPALALWLAAPRPVAPQTVPRPEVNQKELARIQELQSGRARSVELKPLPFSVRRVGESVRQVGATANLSDSARVHAELRGHFRTVLRASGTEELLRLRAVQTQLFLRAVERLRDGARTDPELQELAGNFEERARRSAWLPQGSRIVFSEPELSAFYLFYWTDLVGALGHAEFRPTLQEIRTYYRALLEHPEAASGVAQDSRRLFYVKALEKRDAHYPAALARGVLHYRLGQHAASAAAFLEHLAADPDGQYALRARNHLLAALADSALAE